MILDAVMTIYKCYVVWKNVTGNFHDQFEVICGIEHMIKDDVVTEFLVICG
jgi:hypothetical protein